MCKLCFHSVNKNTQTVFQPTFLIYFEFSLPLKGVCQIINCKSYYYCFHFNFRIITMNISKSRPYFEGECYNILIVFSSITDVKMFLEIYWINFCIIWIELIQKTRQARDELIVSHDYHVIIHITWQIL